MLRKTLTILSLIGLLLSVGLWCFSYYGVEFWRIQALGNPNDNYFILVVDGKALGSRIKNVGGRSELFTWYRFGLQARLTGEGAFQGGGLRWWRPYWSGSVLRSFQVSLWLPVALSACSCFILLRVPLHRRRKRKKLGLCLKCGYDLRGSKERCPECGTGISK